MLMSVKIMGFWNVTLCSMVDGYHTLYDVTTSEDDNHKINTERSFGK
jgi:hypothetical protein